VNSARLSRYEIVEIMYKDTFEEVAKGKLLGLVHTGEANDKAPW